MKARLSFRDVVISTVQSHQPHAMAGYVALATVPRKSFYVSEPTPEFQDVETAREAIGSSLARIVTSIGGYFSRSSPSSAVKEDILFAIEDNTVGFEGMGYKSVLAAWMNAFIRLSEMLGNIKGSVDDSNNLGVLEEALRGSMGDVLQFLKNTSRLIRDNWNRFTPEFLAESKELAARFEENSGERLPELLELHVPELEPAP